jgi:hypothetical protein
MPELPMERQQEALYGVGRSRQTIIAQEYGMGGAGTKFY